MSRRAWIGATAVLMALAGCGARNLEPPSDVENACSIVQERPRYLNAMERTEKNWGVPVPVLMAIIHQESKFDGDARTPFRWSLGVIPMGRQSSAYGYSQALDGTWEEYKRATGNRNARRDRIQDATDFMGWYLNESRKRNGLSLSDARRQYLAYHEGWTGYQRGSYNAKGWLVGVAERVGDRAVVYDLQLRSCGKR